MTLTYALTLAAAALCDLLLLFAFAWLLLHVIRLVLPPRPRKETAAVRDGAEPRKPR